MRQILFFLFSLHLNYAIAAGKCTFLFSEKAPPSGVRLSAPPQHWQQLDPQSRFIITEDLKKSYLSTPEKIVDHDGEMFEIGIIDPSDEKVALRISSVLSRSIEMSRSSNKGHIPDRIVDRVQDLFVSPEAVKTKWAVVGNRFVISRKARGQDHVSEVLGTILVTKNHDTIFFLSGQHDNLKPIRNASGKIENYIDHAGNMINQDLINKKIGSKMPQLSSYKPDGLYQIVNFAFLPETRGLGIGKQVLLEVINQIKRSPLDRHGKKLFEKTGGKGFWQVGEPPWQKRMQPMNFSADPSQHVYLVPLKNSREVILETGGMNNVQFNASYDVFSEYYIGAELVIKNAGMGTTAVNHDVLEKLKKIMSSEIGQELEKGFLDHPEKKAELILRITHAGIKFPERLYELFDMAKSGTAKLQYKNLEASFEDVISSGRNNRGN